MADLNPLEEAVGLPGSSWTNSALHRNRSPNEWERAVLLWANAVRLLRLPDAVKTKVIGQDISEGHARALLPLEEADLQIEALETVLRQGLNVRQTEELVRRMLQRAAPRTEPTQQTRALSPEEQALETEFRQMAEHQGSVGAREIRNWSSRYSVSIPKRNFRVSTKSWSKGSRSPD